MGKVLIDGVQYVPAPVCKLKPQQFSALIRTAREIRKETLSEAADAVGTSKSYLWELERGTSSPTLGLLQKLLTHYGIRFEQIAEL